jgi:putative glutamine amidotransferase
MAAFCPEMALFRRVKGETATSALSRKGGLRYIRPPERGTQGDGSVGGGQVMGQRARPFIGINADFLAGTKTMSPQIRLHVGYCDTILAAGGLPLIMPPLGKPAEMNAFLDRLDGFLLTGGLDMDPRRQRLPSHPAVHSMAERREESDRLLVQDLLDRQMPLLAVGVGMQEINAACGGTLYLHLPEDLPRALPHRDGTGGPHRHAVLLEANTRINEIYGGGELRVNSDHHQAVRQLGEGLRIGARAPDGIIEAIEAEDADWFCIGVQWHPESETASALDRQLFEAFIQASLRRSQPLQLAA